MERRVGEALMRAANAFQQALMHMML